MYIKQTLSVIKQFNSIFEENSVLTFKNIRFFSTTTYFYKTLRAKKCFIKILSISSSFQKIIKSLILPSI